MYTYYNQYVCLKMHLSLKEFRHLPRRITQEPVPDLLTNIR
jgi:hypothetical protein